MKTHSGILSIQPGLYGLSYFLRHPDGDRYRFIPYEAAVPADLNEILEKIYREDWQDLSPATVRVFHHNRLHTLVPEELFVAGKEKDFLQYNVRLLPTDTVETDKNLPFETVNIYVPYENVNNFFVDKFGEIDYFHSATPFLTYMATAHDPEKTEVFVRFFPSDFQMAVLHKNRLEFYNTFPMQNMDDFLYYFFYVWEKKELNGREPEVHLIGNADRIAAAEAELKTFWPHIHRHEEAEKYILNQPL